MGKSLKTPAPLIMTADHKAIDLGMTVFGIDTDCENERTPKIEVLKVIQIDLGPSRKIRLRRSNGTEYTWTAQEGQSFASSKKKSCSRRTAEKLVFANRKKAAKVVVLAMKAYLPEVIKENFHSKKTLAQKLAYARKSHNRELEQIRNEDRQAHRKVNAYKNKIKAVR